MTKVGRNTEISGPDYRFLSLFKKKWERSCASKAFHLSIDQLILCALFGSGRFFEKK